MSFLLIRDESLTVKRMWSDDDRDDVHEGFLRIVDLKYKNVMVVTADREICWVPLKLDPYCNEPR